MDYLIKPFQASRFEEALTGGGKRKWRWKNISIMTRPSLTANPRQQLQRAGSSSLAKRLTPQTLRTLCQWIDAHQDYEFQPTSWLTRLTFRVFPAVNTYLAGQLPHLVHQYPLWRHGAPVYRYRIQAEHYSLLKQYCHNGSLVICK